MIETDRDGKATPSPAAGRQLSAIAFLYDGANLLTLAGLLCGVLAIYLIARGFYTAAMIALLWALFCDWFDGPLARRTSRRTAEHRAFGAQLDSLADMVSSGVAPAVLLLGVGDLRPSFLPGAFLLVLAGAIRLAHFSVFGLDDQRAYRGLPIDTNIVVVTAVFALHSSLSGETFSWLLYAVVVVLAVMNVAPFRSPKLVGGWYYAIAAYVLGMTFFYARLLVP